MTVPGNRGVQGLTIPSTGKFWLPDYTPYLILQTQTWRHPQPGVPLNFLVVAIGGGGGGGGTNTAGGAVGGSGGGSGRIVFQQMTLTADQAVVIGAGGNGGIGVADGGVGGTTTFGTTISAAGGNGGGYGADGGGPQYRPGGDGGCGGGGGGVNGNHAGSAGGNGLDWIGGAGGQGKDIGANGVASYGSAGYSTNGPPPHGGVTNAFYTGSSFNANMSPCGMWPNGGFYSGSSASGGGGGGDLSVLFPWVMGWGRGGRGSPLNGTNTGLNGIQGAVWVIPLAPAY